jgi:hypothetical protein
MSELPWNERVTQISIHPEAASRKDVARLASELMEERQKARVLVDTLEVIAFNYIGGDDCREIANEALSKWREGKPHVS